MVEMKGKLADRKAPATVAVTLFFSLLLIGTSTQPPPGITPPPQLTTIDREYKLGDAAMLGGLDFSVVRCERVTSLKDGYEFIVVHVRYRNTSESSCSFTDDPNKVYLMEDFDEGNYSPVSLTIDIDKPYAAYSFAAGEEATGVYVYELEKGRYHFVLHFYSSDHGENYDNRYDLGL